MASCQARLESKCRLKRAQQGHVQAAAVRPASPDRPRRARSSTPPAASAAGCTPLGRRPAPPGNPPRPAEPSGLNTCGPKRTSLVTEPPRWLMPWISLFFTSQPGAGTPRSARMSEALSTPCPPRPAMTSWSRGSSAHVRHSWPSPQHVSRRSGLVAYCCADLAGRQQARAARATITVSSSPAAGPREQLLESARAPPPDRRHARSRCPRPGPSLRRPTRRVGRGQACGRCPDAPAGRSWPWCRCRGSARTWPGGGGL